MNNNVLRLGVFGLFQILADDLGNLRIDQVVGFFFAKTRDIISGDLLLKFSRGACIQFQRLNGNSDIVSAVFSDCTIRPGIAPT